MGASSIEARLRGLLLAILVISIVGTGIDLLLLGHTDTVWHQLPLWFLGAALVSTVAVAVRPSRTSLRILQGLMALSAGSGALGLYLHYKGNTEFELEMYPAMAGFELFKESMMGATPALAPGAMTMLGVLGLAYAYKHPQLRKGEPFKGENQ